MPQVSLSEFIQGVCSDKQLVSFPTDTVPALASHPAEAEQIFVLKRRDPDKPLILMAATFTDLLPYTVGTPAEKAIWRQTATRFWPGALTLVVPASDRVPAAMNPQQTGTIGIRVPNQPLARYLLAQTGPLATTSVNRSGEPALLTLTAIEAEFPQLLTLSGAALHQVQPLLGGYTAQAAARASGVPSTVALWQTDGWQILRQGDICLS
ncbi:MAG: L-threonylcarbamoyladenylate synthase [Leptolyngbyaceae cyanobacterium SM1_1_3]|nr:L-threonylcarbamoyladenylate synthase [Leptolyngbyaceae cyanobacterium SM1_1_3]NJN04532.1 L-threonylcarbamoyladenylate synthase [Leptolyngbyaceae cyanobacterium RM1_1_2]NJO08407.1 L-threonylcarbamoyladenylate synthase [Leptolyngbyaceae cyanobacterium SL_1_1]